MLIKAAGLKNRSVLPWMRKIIGVVCLQLWMLAVAGLLQAPGLEAKEKQKAPTTKTVSGLVTDQAESGISGAEITIKDLQTGKTVAIYTDANGEYRISGLDPHHDYEVHAGYKGVNSETRQVSSVDTRMKIVVNLIVPSPKS
jgi:hypothetical protein